MWDLALHVAYMSTVICILYFQETTAAPIYGSNTFQNFIDGDYYIYSEKSQKAIDCEDDVLKEAERDGFRNYQQFKFQKDMTHIDWYHIYCEHPKGVKVVKETHFFSSDTFSIKKDVFGNTDDHLFQFEITNEGYVIKSKSGYVWDANGDLKGSPITNTYDESQMFRIIEDKVIDKWDSTKKYFIYSIKSGLAIDCSTSSDHVQQYTRNNGANQQFHIKGYGNEWEITCSDSNDCWELTIWGNVIHTTCYDWSAQRFYFLQRPEGIAIMPRRDDLTLRRIVDIDSSGTGQQLIGEKKWRFDHNQVFRISESPLTPESFATCATASYLPSPGIRANWMSYIPQSQTINRISIPGTHDTMCGNDIICKPTCNWAKTQELSLLAQLNAGVRALDIRLVIRDDPHRNKYFQVFHGGNKYWSYDSGHSFSDVLSVTETFLQQNPSEFILMRVEREQKHQSQNDFLNMFQTIYNKNPNLFWTKQHIPTVQAVAGKVIVLQGFAFGGAHIYGLRYKPPHDFFNFVQDNYTLNGRDKFQVIKDQFIRAQQFATPTQFYVNYLSSIGGIPPFPYHGSCLANYLRGSLPIYGSNPKAYDYMIHYSRSFVGIIYMDFPGQVLIDKIITTNPSLQSYSNQFTAKHGIRRWITDIVKDKLNNNDNVVRILFNKYALILFAFIILLIILNIYCVYLYFVKTKVKSNTYDLVSTHNQSDIEDLSI